jgi:hypothetical protein
MFRKMKNIFCANAARCENAHKKDFNCTPRVLIVGSMLERMMDFVLLPIKEKI